jgi:hypothetical protein
MLLYLASQPSTLKLPLLTFTSYTVWPVPSYWLQKLAILWFINACALLLTPSGYDPHTPSPAPLLYFPLMFVSFSLESFQHSLPLPLTNLSAPSQGFIDQLHTRANTVCFTIARYSRRKLLLLFNDSVSSAGAKYRRLTFDYHVT